MLAFILRRLLLFLPTLLVILLVAFGLSELTPGDRVAERFEAGGGEFVSTTTPDKVDRAYRGVARRYALDQPAFYVSLHPAAYPDTLHRYFRRARRATLEALIGQYGNWPAVEAYYRAVLSAERALYALPPDTPGLADLQRRVATLPTTADEAVLADFWGRDFADAPALLVPQRRYRALRRSESSGRYWPRLVWHGTTNRFHRYFSGVLRGDLGTSYRDGRPVATRIRESLGWTLLLSLSSMALSFLIAVPLGVWSATRRSGRASGAVALLLYAGYSLPVFWVATLLLVFFTTPEYGMDWFDGQYRPRTGDAGFWTTVAEGIGFLVLPICCLTYPRLAYLYAQVRGGMQAVWQQPYILLARAKGLPQRAVIWRHAFRSALFPLITILGYLFPRAVAGSIVVESIFSIPGMGRLTLQAIRTEDWPIVFGVLLLGGGLTLTGVLVSDVLYFLADPRLRQAQRA